MLRVFLAIVIAFTLPAVLYVLWRSFVPPRFGGSQAIHRGNWEDMPWVTLALIGVVLLALWMGYLAIAEGAELARGARAPAGTGGS